MNRLSETASCRSGQRRIVKLTDQEVKFWTKDKRQKKRVTAGYPIREFVARDYGLDLLPLKEVKQGCQILSKRSTERIGAHRSNENFFVTKLTF